MSSYEKISKLINEREVDITKFPNPLPATHKGFLKKGTKDGDKDDDIVVTKDVQVSVSKLKPSQDAIYLGKSLLMAVNGVEGGDLGAVISKDNYILDGHHRYAATTFNNPSAKVGGVQSDLYIVDLIPVLRAAGDAMKNKRGVEPKGGDVNIFKATIEDVKDVIYNGANVDSRYYNKTKAVQWFERIGESTIKKRLELLQSKKSPSSAPARKDMPKITPNQVNIVKQLLNKGKIDVRAPYAENKIMKNVNKLRDLVYEVIKEETEYQKFFKAELEKSGKTIGDMGDDEKKEFFNMIDRKFKAKDESINELDDKHGNTIKVGHKYQYEKNGTIFTAKGGNVFSSPTNDGGKQTSSMKSDYIKKLYPIKESINENADLKKVIDIVKKNKGKSLVSLPFKDELSGDYSVSMSTESPMPPHIQIKKKRGGKGMIVVLNKKYTDDADFVQGDIAVGIMEGNLHEGLKLKSKKDDKTDDKKLVKYGKDTHDIRTEVEESVAGHVASKAMQVAQKQKMKNPDTKKDISVASGLTSSNPKVKKQATNIFAKLKNRFDNAAAGKGWSDEPYQDTGRKTVKEFTKDEMKEILTIVKEHKKINGLASVLRESGYNASYATAGVPHVYIQRGNQKLVLTRSKNMTNESFTVGKISGGLIKESVNNGE